MLGNGDQKKKRGGYRKMNEAGRCWQRLTERREKKKMGPDGTAFFLPVFPEHLLCAEPSFRGL